MIDSKKRVYVVFDSPGMKTGKGSRPIPENTNITYKNNTTLSKLLILFIRFNFVSQNIYSNRVKRQPTTDYPTNVRITEYFPAYSDSPINICVKQFSDRTLE